jgi:uncharacterized protein YqiB (DUF1249 family)
MTSGVGIVKAVKPARGKIMMKTIEVMGDAVRSQKHPFRKTEHHSNKSLKNRHERHKIKEYLNLNNWLAKEIELSSV